MKYSTKYLGNSEWSYKSSNKKDKITIEIVCGNSWKSNKWTFYLHTAQYMGYNFISEYEALKAAISKLNELNN